MELKKIFLVTMLSLLTATAYGSVLDGQREHIPGTSLNLPSKDVNLRVMSYNIRIDNDKDKGTENDWTKRKSRVEWMIGHYKADVIGIQEPCKDQLYDLMDEFGDRYSVIFAEETPDAYVHPERYPSEFYLETNAILYRKDRIELIGSVQKFWLSEDPFHPPTYPAWDGSDRSRVVVYALFRDKHTNELFYVFNTHFETGGKIVRVESAKLLMESVIRIAGTKPSIIMGDFNTFNDKNGIAAYQAFNSYSEEFSNVYDIAEHEFGKRGTWVGFRYSTFTEEDLETIYPGIPSRYDHMFVSKQVTVVNTGVADDKFLTEWGGVNVEVPASDHRPIISDVILSSVDECSQGLDALTLATLVDQVSKGLNPDTNTAVSKRLDDPEMMIPEIPQLILNEVFTHLTGGGDLDIETMITPKNYQHYLNAAKYLDLLTKGENQRTTYPLRLACLQKSEGKLKTLEAFSYRLNPGFFEDFDECGVFIPSKKHELYQAGQFELNFVPEWLEIQKHITREVIETVQCFSIQLGYANPHLILFTGTYGSGKSYQVRHHRLTENIKFDPQALFSGVLSTDAIKRIYMAFAPGATNGQVHHEGVSIRLQIMMALFTYYPHLTIIQEAVLSTESSIVNQIALAEDNGFKVKIVDTDADLETSCMRILSRDPSKGDSVPHFRATAAAEKMVRINRAILLEKVQNKDDIAEYELIFSERGKTYLVAQKLNGEFQILPGQEERYFRALSPAGDEIVETIAKKVITRDDCLVFGRQLEKFLGMTIEDAILQLSKH